eukprot:CAMPEP_0201251108 /NCGR_PEP_ID=MMETSP0852-20130820/65960_1 /ASSEMBLY_ACC=CAM_ASM_000632 /TAXON_ID=183588 /ORGANISM="Pseudo-nitzschia fraudulenta, Strain WWA7" /LENGTH=297 /DNA_ID=CAMNT_0047550655 /DNA_START=40 /DNA_END=933 /DNA_ORIENTATION=+
MASPFALTTNEIRLLHNQCDANKSSDGQPSTIAAEVPSFDSENDPPHLSSIRSTATMRTSNTTKRRSEKKLEKQAFLYFLEILMSLVKEKDEKVFRHAKLVICRCEQQKRRGEIESFVESLRYPLKLAVGPRFWAEARERLRRALLRSCPGRPSLISAVEQLVEPSNHVSGASVCSAPSAMLKSKTRSKNTTVTKTARNRELMKRKMRLWLVISVFMEDLRRNDSRLYHKAHELAKECMKRYRQGQHLEQKQYNNSLSGSIRTCLKKEIGTAPWRRAEKHVGQILLAHFQDHTITTR